MGDGCCHGDLFPRPQLNEKKKGTASRKVDIEGLDELQIMTFPIVLVQGRSLFEDLKSRVPLTLLRVRQFDSGNLLLTYRPLPTLAPAFRADGFAQ